MVGASFFITSRSTRLDSTLRPLGKVCGSRVSSTLEWRISKEFCWMISFGFMNSFFVKNDHRNLSHFIVDCRWHFSYCFFVGPYGSNIDLFTGLAFLFVRRPAVQKWVGAKGRQWKLVVRILAGTIQGFRFLRRKLVLSQHTPTLNFYEVLAPFSCKAFFSRTAILVSLFKGSIFLF